MSHLRKLIVGVAGVSLVALAMEVTATRLAAAPQQNNSAAVSSAWAGPAAVPRLILEPLPGRRPAPLLMQRIDRAALSDSRGEVALSAATVLGPQGAGDLAPDVVVRLVRALQTAGIHDAAHALATEALLLRPRGGAALGR